MSKLREKFKKASLDFPLIPSPTEKDILDYENALTKSEQIADDFAVKFANWLMMYTEKTIYINQYVYKNKEMHITELLQIFKDKYYEQ